MRTMAHPRGAAATIRRVLPLAIALSVAAAAPLGDARPLPFYYDLYTFRGDDGGTDVVAAFAVPAGRLEWEDTRDGGQYRFDVTLVLADTALQTVSRTDDSVFVGLPRPLGADHLLYTHIAVPARPSSSTVHRVIMTDATRPGIGQLYDGGFPIRDYGGSALMLSDVALGQPDARAGWKRRNVTLALLPTTHLPSSAFDVYYEIYNLPHGSEYTTEIAVEFLDPVFDDDDGDLDAGRPGADRGVRLRFEAESQAGRDHTAYELRRVDTALGHGRYRMTVTVQDHESGRTASRSRTFEVRGPAGGATMVPALPVRANVLSATDPATD